MSGRRITRALLATIRRALGIRSPSAAATADWRQTLADAEQAARALTAAATALNRHAKENR